MLTEAEKEDLACLCEYLRDEARMELIAAAAKSNTDVAAIYSAMAVVRVNQANAVRKLLKAAGIRDVGPEWKIENNRVCPA